MYVYKCPPPRAGTLIRANAIDSNKHVPMQKFGLILHHNSASTSLPHFGGGGPPVS